MRLASGARSTAAPSRGATYTLLAFVAWAILSSQSFLNGRLGSTIGSSLYAAALSTAVGFALLLLYVVARGAWSVVRSTLASPDVPRWQKLSGLLGGVLIGLSTHSAPVIGVVLLTLAMVCGQTLGGLVVDDTGVGPAGTVPIEPARVAGCALAIVAVGLGLLDGTAVASWSLLLLMAAAGAGFSIHDDPDASAGLAGRFARSTNMRTATLPACATTPVPSPVTDKPVDHKVRFTCGVPFISGVLGRS